MLRRNLLRLSYPRPGQSGGIARATLAFPMPARPVRGRHAVIAYEVQQFGFPERYRLLLNGRPVADVPP